MPLHLASIVSVQATGTDRAGVPHAYTTRLECFQLTRGASAVMESQSSRTNRVPLFKYYVTLVHTFMQNTDGYSDHLLSIGT